MRRGGAPLRSDKIDKAVHEVHGLQFSPGPGAEGRGSTAPGAAHEKALLRLQRVHRLRKGLLERLPLWEAGSFPGEGQDVGRFNGSAG